MSEKELKERVKFLERELYIRDRRLELIDFLAIDYDGYSTVDDLKSLIDDIRAITAGSEDEEIIKILDK